MWFKNILAYQITDSNLDITSDLENKLQSKRAKPCTFQEMATYGFVAPYGDHGTKLWEQAKIKNWLKQNESKLPNKRTRK